MIIKTLLTGFAVSGFTVLSSAAELVYNGDFTLQDSSGVYGAGWTVHNGANPNLIFSNWYANGFPDAPNAVSAFLGVNSNNTDTISQDIDTAGYGLATLAVRFKSDGYDLTGKDYLHCWFGGQPVGLVDVGSDGQSPFEQTAFFDLKPLFNGSVRTLDIDVALDSGAATFVWVESVSIQAQAVPEPTTVAALGLGAAVVLRRRARR